MSTTLLRLGASATTWTGITIALDSTLILFGAVSLAAAWRLLGPRLGHRLTFAVGGLVLLSYAHLFETVLGFYGFEGNGSPEVLHRVLVLLGFLWLMAGLGNIARDLLEGHGRLQTQAEEAREEREKTQAVVNHMTDGVLVVDGASRILSANRAFEEMMGVGQDELHGSVVSHILTRFAEGSETPFQPQDSDVGTTIDLFAAERPHALWWSAAVSRLAGDADQPRYVLVLRDVSRLRQLELMKTDFVALVSHELRRPVTNLALAAELYREQVLLDLPEGHPGRRISDILSSESARARALVEDILTAARFEAGQLTMEPRVLGIADIVQEVLEAARPESSSDRIAVRGLNGQHVHADPLALRLVIYNLVDNALKYSDAQVEIIVEECAGFVFVCVSDRGLGIPADQLLRIFDRFQRLDHRDTRTTYGFGLGLYIAKNITDAMGGRLEVESAVGSGSLFRLVMPSAPAPNETNAGGDPQGEAACANVS